MKQNTVIIFLLILINCQIYFIKGKAAVFPKEHGKDDDNFAEDSDAKFDGFENGHFSELDLGDGILNEEMIRALDREELDAEENGNRT